MKSVTIHPTDPPVELGNGAFIDEVAFKGVGSVYGRFIFTDHVLVRVTGTNVTIRNCLFTGGTSALSKCN